MLDYSHLFALKRSSVINEMIRVDHAGEFGAMKIYIGQLQVLKNDTLIKEMYEGEIEHFEYFQNIIKKYKIRPTILMPIWNIYGFMAGFLSASVSRETAMVVTEAIENVIEKHYAKQIEIVLSYIAKEHDDLAKEQLTDLMVKITKFREDELHHAMIGSENGKQSRCLYHIVSICTKVAISLSEKF